MQEKEKKFKSEVKVHAAMNSLARHIEFSKRKAPQIIIDQETRLLANHFGNLTLAELQETRLLWPTFHKKRQSSIEKESALLEERLKTEVFSID